MQQPQIPGQDERTYCLRHPNTESNLRCGRCDDVICPRCMVTAPVGVRCPDCARIGRPAVLDTSSSELGRAILSAVGTGVAGGLVLTLFLLVIDAVGLGIIGIILAAAGLVGIGVLVGEAVRYGSGKKLDRRLKYVGAGGVFAAWASTVVFSQLFGVPVGYVGGLIGIAGLIAAFYVASSRLRT